MAFDLNSIKNIGSSGFGATNILGPVLRMLGWIVIIGVLFGGFFIAYFLLTMRKYRVVVYNERHDGTVIKEETRGGFVKNFVTRTESFRIWNNKKEMIKPIPNHFICTINN